MKMTDDPNMRRREFLTRMGLAGMALPLGLGAACGKPGAPAATAGAAADTAAAAVSAAASGPKVGLCTIAFQERPLFEVLELAAQVGFDGVEPWGKPDHVPLNTPDERVREIRAKLDSLGLACSHYGSYVRLGEEHPAGEQQTNMKRSLEIADILGTRIVRIWAGDKNSEQLSAADWDRIVEDAKVYCGLAEPKGMQLAMEMHGNTLTNRAAAMVELINKVGSPALKANYQILNDTEDPYERASVAAPYTVMVHAQNVAPGGGEQQSLISEGAVDFNRIYGILAAAGFKGYFEVEFVKGAGYEEKVDSLQRDCAYLKTIGKKA
ncbi:sugar phosphate isomerase/epimerase [bacterium]|nr:sugar phosphate isomerase/epimerase [bacterium]